MQRDLTRRAASPGAPMHRVARSDFGLPRRFLIPGLAAGTLLVLFAPSLGAPGTFVPSLAAPLQTAVVDPSWHHLYPSTVPTGLPQSPVVYDPVDHELVVITELELSSGIYFHTWVYYSGNWHKLYNTSTPPGGVATWDGHDGYELLPSPGGHWWTFLHNKWTGHFSSTTPPGQQQAMAYDGAAGEVVLFGGCIPLGGKLGCASIDQTWTYAGGVWTHRYPATHPSARIATALGYDARDGVLVLFGGFSTYLLSDTWTFAGNEWTHRYPSVHPSAREYPTVASDAQTDSYLLQGGDHVCFPCSYNDTWAYVNGQWARVSTTGPMWYPSSGSMAYDSAAGRLISVGQPMSRVETTSAWAYY